MSTTDGLSMNVPYILPKGLCYEEMVGENYPLLYSGKKEFVKMTDYTLQNLKPLSRNPFNN